MLDKLLYRLSRPLVGMYARLMLRMDILRQRPLPKEPVILAANHPSTTDPLLIPLLTSRQASILIAEKIFTIPVLGSYLRRSGHIAVVPGKGETILAQARRMLEQGRDVIIFPEGAVSPHEGAFHRGRTGVARLALQTGAPVIPIGIHLDYRWLKAMASRINGRAETVSWYWRGPYYITVGETLYLDGDVDDRTRVLSIAKTIMDAITRLSQQSAQRMQATVA